MSPPEVWGPAIWTLFHALAEKVHSKAYPLVRNSLFATIVQICKVLPCPDCSRDASQFLAKLRVTDYKTKLEFKNMLYIFHNWVNAKKRKPLFNYAHMQKYSNANLQYVVKNFISKYNTKGNMKLLTEAFQRSFVLRNFLAWFRGNSAAFMPEIPTPVLTPPIAVQEPEMQQPEMQQPEMQQPEMQQPEMQQPEMQQPETQQPEMQQPEMQQPEMQQPEIQEGEKDEEQVIELEVKEEQEEVEVKEEEEIITTVLSLQHLDIPILSLQNLDLEEEPREKSEVEESEPIVEEPIVEEPIAEEPIAEEPLVEEPEVEEPLVEEPEVEEPLVEESQSALEEPVIALDRESSFSSTKNKKKGRKPKK